MFEQIDKFGKAPGRVFKFSRVEADDIEIKLNYQNIEDDQRQ